MAEPVRNDEPLSSNRFPQSPSTTEPARPGPVPLVRPIDTLNSKALSESAEPHAPLGEWPKGTLRSERINEGDYSESGTAEVLRHRLEKVAQKTNSFVHDRITTVRSRFKSIRSRAESGELQNDLKERANELAETASRKASSARSRAELYARNHPVQFIAGSAATAFAIGFFLRMWRDDER